ncbi:translation initiation factor IF-2-like [Panicum virgatum]|uniref:Uncharacterized protein n=1 Tax=Panicum virgatum TaxID=38727 RepID=A0A8T0TJK4_PANVG|nr:translation initiation factor IF-2-like [Panicum virgatum]KAG2612051.1 hypothetical protein PVAP13_4KG236515 [Panicum virgatum]
MRPAAAVTANGHRERRGHSIPRLGEEPRIGRSPPATLRGEQVTTADPDRPTVATEEGERRSAPASAHRGRPRASALGEAERCKKTLPRREQRPQTPPSKLSPTPWPNPEGTVAVLTATRQAPGAAVCNTSVTRGKCRCCPATCAATTAAVATRRPHSTPAANAAEPLLAALDAGVAELSPATLRCRHCRASRGQTTGAAPPQTCPALPPCPDARRPAPAASVPRRAPPQLLMLRHTTEPRRALAEALPCCAWAGHESRTATARPAPPRATSKPRPGERSPMQTPSRTATTAEPRCTDVLREQIKRPSGRIRVRTGWIRPRTTSSR